MKIQILKRVSSKEKAFFTRQLAAMLGAGIPLVRALATINSQVQNPLFNQILQEISQRLEEGYGLSQILRQYPKVFDHVYTSIVEAGEASGKLTVVLEELASRLEEENRFMMGVYNALLYPVFVMLAMMGVSIFLLLRIIPQLKLLFAESNVQLPFFTRVLIGTADFVTRFWYIVLIFLIGGILALRLYLKTEAGQKFLSRLQLKTPVFKNIFLGIHMTRFSRTLGMLSSAGVPVIESVGIVGDTMNNIDYKEAMLEVTRNLEHGIPMSTPLSTNAFFPPLVSQMILVGEQTGRIDDILIKLADYYEETTESQIKAFSGLIEPFLIVIVGIGVAFVVFAILMPIYQLAQVVE